MGYYMDRRIDHVRRAESAAQPIQRSLRCTAGPRHHTHSVLAFKYQAIIAFLVCTSLIASYRLKSDYRTPDEITFADGVLLERSYSDGTSLLGDGSTINLKYILTTFVLKHVFKGDLLLAYLANSALVVWVMLRSYRILVEDAAVLKDINWAIMFLLPNIAFYSTSLLRDIHVFVGVYLLLTYYQERNTKGLLASWLVVALLRPEVGFILLLAGVLARRSVRLIMTVGLCYVLAYWLLFDHFLEHYMHALRSYNTLGIWEFSHVPENSSCAVLTNIVLFWFPFVMSEIPGRMTEVYRIESWLLVSVIVMGVVRFSRSRFRNEQLYCFCIVTLYLYFPIASMEYNAYAAIRHMLSLLPVLWIACMSVPIGKRFWSNRGVELARNRRMSVSLVR